MLAFTRHQEQSLIVGEAIRILVLGVGPGGVRLGVDAPEPIDVRRDEDSSDCDPRRRDLINWHPDPRHIAELIRERFPEAGDDIHLTRTGVAYTGPDPCLFALMSAFTQGLASGGRQSPDCGESPESRVTQSR